MLEDHLKLANPCRRLRSGPARTYIDEFADWLRERGYPASSRSLMLRSLAAWTDWLTEKGFTDGDFVVGYEACRTELSEHGRGRYQRGPNRNSMAAAAALIRFLRERGVLAAARQPLPLSERWPLLTEFRKWMLQHQGVTDGTIERYERYVADFIVASGVDPSSYSAASVRSFMVTRSERHKVATAQMVATAMRAFLRFLGATGQCSEGLIHAVPRFASYQLAATPRFLEPEQLEKLIGALSDEDAVGARDRAVVLLLARLGLRASEVAELTFDAIDWQNGRIAVCGKGRRQHWLPLPQQVGDAIVTYLRRGRPPLPVPQVFVSALAPRRPMTRQAVSSVVCQALRRAGVKAPHHGAHLLRHSAATAMLRNGVSLAGIASVLRHRSPKTTAHYAKIDFDLLGEIAQPWPEATSC